MSVERRVAIEASRARSQKRLDALGEAGLRAQQYIKFLQRGPFPDYVKVDNAAVTLARMRAITAKVAGRQLALREAVEQKTLPAIAVKTQKAQGDMEAIVSYFEIETSLADQPEAVNQAYDMLQAVLGTKAVTKEVVEEEETFTYPSGGKARGYVARVLRFLDPLSPEAGQRRPTTHQVIAYAYGKYNRDTADKGHTAISRARENLKRNTQGRLTIVVEGLWSDRPRGLPGAVLVRGQALPAAPESAPPAPGGLPEVERRKRKFKDRLSADDVYDLPDGEKVQGMSAKLLKMFRPFDRMAQDSRFSLRQLVIEVYGSDSPRNYNRFRANVSKLNALLEGRYKRRITPWKDKEGKSRGYFNEALDPTLVVKRTRREIILPVIDKILSEPGFDLRQISNELGLDRRGGKLGKTQILATLAGGLIWLEEVRQQIEAGREGSLSDYEKGLLEKIEIVRTKLELASRWDVALRILRTADPAFPDRWEKSGHPANMAPPVAKKLYRTFLEPVGSLNS